MPSKHREIEEINATKTSETLFSNLTVRNIPKFKDREACVYQQTNQNIAPVLKNFQNNGPSRRTELNMHELTVLV